MIVLLSLAVGIVVVPTWSFWLWFMVRRPARWTEFVDRENAFWVQHGVISKRIAAILQRLEKGYTLKIVVALGILVGLALMLFCN
jgi:hypothetical protein